MTKINALVRDHGFIPTVRAFAAPAAFAELERQIRDHGPLKGVECFSSPAPNQFEDYAGEREGSNSGPFFYGPFNEGAFLQLWFMASGLWRREQAVTYNWVDYDPRHCHYHPGCDHGWEDDDEGCDYCEVDTDLCTTHNTYH